MMGYSKDEFIHLLRRAIGGIPGCELTPGYMVLVGEDSWTMGTDYTAVSIYVDNVNDSGDPPTLQTEAGTENLFQNTTIQFTAEDGNRLRQPLVVTTKESDRVLINYTRK